MNELNHKLRTEAIGLGLCEQWQGDWQRDKTRDQLIAMFKRGIDFCIERKWPSVDFVRQHFLQRELHENQVHFGEDDLAATFDNGVAVCKECKGEITIKPLAVNTLYLIDCEDVHITALRQSILYIHLYDSNARVNTIGGHVKVYRHGESKVSAVGNVEMRK